MPFCPHPFNEGARLEDLHRVVPADPDDDPIVQDIVRLVRVLLDCPMAMVTLVDAAEARHPARDGIVAERTVRSEAFCAQTIMSDEPLVVPDALADPRWADLPHVAGAPHVRHYVGVPIVTSRGYRIGTLCALDVTPREAPPVERLDLLRTLADRVALRLERHAEADDDPAAEAKSEFVALVGHELRTPLTVLLGNAMLLEHRLTDQADRAMIAAVTRSGTHLRDLIERIIRYSQLETGDLGLAEDDWPLTDLAALAVETMRPLAAAAGKTLSLSGPAQDALVYVDREQIQLALTCIVKNALTHGGDTVEVGVRREADGCFALSVSDDGAALDGRRMRALAAPFVVGERTAIRRTSGIGLGLPLARRIVDLHGGRMSVLSDGGRTAIDVILPAWRLAGLEAVRAGAAGT